MDEWASQARLLDTHSNIGAGNKGFQEAGWMDSWPGGKSTGPGPPSAFARESDVCAFRWAFRLRGACQQPDHQCQSPVRRMGLSTLTINLGALVYRPLRVGSARR